MHAPPPQDFQGHRFGRLAGAPLLQPALLARTRACAPVRAQSQHPTLPPFAELAARRLVLTYTRPTERIRVAPCTCRPLPCDDVGFGWMPIYGWPPSVLSATCARPVRACVFLPPVARQGPEGQQIRSVRCSQLYT